jgi:hypothetical protein
MMYLRLRPFILAHSLPRKLQNRLHLDRILSLRSPRIHSKPQAEMRLAWVEPILHRCQLHMRRHLSRDCRRTIQHRLFPRLSLFLTPQTPTHAPRSCTLRLR